MRPLLLILLSSITVGLFAGCNTDPRGRRELALMRSEIIDLEDKYYALKSRNGRLVKRLSKYEDVTEDSFEDLGLQIFDSEPYEECDEVIIENQPPSNSILNTDDAAETPSETEPQTNRTYRKPRNFAREIQAAHERRKQKRTQKRNKNDRVAEVYIHPNYTSAENVDQVTGDDGLALFLQPRTSSGEAINRSGPITVSLIDPLAKPHFRQIGLWKFTAGEMDLFAVEDANRNGYLLHLPWDINVPRNRSLLISVRYTAQDGRRLEASREVQLQPPRGDYSPDAPLIAEWTENLPVSDEASLDTIDDGAVRRGVRAIPVKSTISPNKPEWRPVR